MMINSNVYRSAMIPKNLTKVLEKIVNSPDERLSFEQACDLAMISYGTLDLFMFANRIRERYKGNKVFLCSIINAKSGKCSEDCAFCAQSGHHNADVAAYPMMQETEMVSDGLRMKEAGATQYSMVTSGFRLSNADINTVSNTAATLQEKTNLNICASLGGLTVERARQLRGNGVSSYHHNLETAKSYFDNICTTHAYEDDIETLKIAKSAGFRVCSGGILGLGESWEQRVELAFTLKDLDVDSIPLNFLNPIAGTPLENQALISPMEALKSIALFRIINSTKDIPICGGREKTLKDFQSWAFLAGANGIMLGNYLTTEGRSAAMDLEMIRDFGLEVKGSAL